MTLITSCETSQEIIKATNEYYKELSYLGINESVVNNYKQAAFGTFLLSPKSLIENPDELYSHFRWYFQNFIAKANTREGIADVLKSDKKKEEKNKQLRHIL